MKKTIAKVIVILISLISTIVFINPINKVQAANTINSTKSNEVSSNSTNTIKSKENILANAKLSNLGVYTYDFKGFKPDITTYETTVPSGVTTVKVYATTQDENATYKVTGNENLKAGKNKVTITVTAADKKTTKEYYINVKKQSNGNSEEQEENADEEENEDKDENSEEVTETNNEPIDLESKYYSEEHVQYGWYIVFGTLIVMTLILLIMVIKSKRDTKIEERKEIRREKRERLERELEAEQKNIEIPKAMQRKKIEPENQAQISNEEKFEELKQRSRKYLDEKENNDNNKNF